MSYKRNQKKEKRMVRHRRVRAKVLGTEARPRLSVFKSASHIYAQIINDENERTLVAYSDLALKGKKMKGVDRAREVGKEIAKEAKGKKIEQVVFDRGGFQYHGRIKALAEGAREGNRCRAIDR